MVGTTSMIKNVTIPQHKYNNFIQIRSCSSQSKETLTPLIKECIQGKEVTYYESGASDEIHSMASTTNQNIFFERCIYFFQTCFFPHGYPQTVSADWKKYYSWAFIQNIFSSATYVLSTNALLLSVGINESMAAPISAGISWVLKDGLGALGNILLARRFGKLFDTDTKRNKWIGDILHNCGTTLECVTPLAPSYFILLASFANILKGLSGLITGATRATFNKHFAQVENLGDITAKAFTQGIASWFIGMSGGIGLSMLPGMQPASVTMFSVLFALSAGHLTSSYFALRSVNLVTLNTQRTSILIKEYLENEHILSPDQVRTLEQFVFRPTTPCITMGASIRSITNSSSELKDLISLFQGEKYFIKLSSRHPTPFIQIAFHVRADSIDLLKAYFNGYYLSYLTEREAGEKTELTPSNTTTLQNSLNFTRQTFSTFIRKLVDSGWSMQNILLPTNEQRCDWELLLPSDKKS